MTLQQNNTQNRLPHYHVTAGLIFKNNKLLITQRLNSDKFGGLWEFPGGKCLENETLEDCLVREISEELNSKIEVRSHLISVDHQYQDFAITLHVFLCRYLSGPVRPIEVQDVQWIDPSDVGKYEFTAADQKVIKKFSIFKDKKPD